MPCFEGFSSGCLVFLPPQKPTSPNSNLVTREELHAKASLVNFLVILGSQHPFSFNFYFMLTEIFSSVRVKKVVVVVVVVASSLNIVIYLLYNILHLSTCTATT